MAMRCGRLQKITELFDRQTRIANDAAHGECIDGIVAWDGNDARAVAHDNMFSLTRDMKARLLESAHSVKVIDTRETRQR